MPLGWTVLLTGLCAGSIQLAAAVSLADFCIIGTPGVLALLPAGGGVANNATFEYFLTCPPGQTSPFATDLLALNSSLPTTEEQAALVSAASGAGAEAAALAESIAAPSTGRLSVIAAAVDRLTSLFDCAAECAAVPENWNATQAAVCETGNPDDPISAPAGM
eukprot:SAG31_NODE_1780_length_7290_cov_1.784036_7_plen_163_part_00